MRILLLLWLASLAPVATADSWSEPCGQSTIRAVISSPVTIAEVERLNMVELPSELMIKSDFQKAPFGERYREWVAFKSLFRTGDQIVKYSSHEREWLRRNGEAGYALIRSGCLIRTFPTMWS